MAGRPIIALVSLILLAAGILFEFFIVLSGVVRVTPFSKTFFLSALTENIPGNSVPSSPRVAWQYFRLGQQGMSKTSATTASYGDVSPAFPFQPRTNFDVPQEMRSMLPPDFRSGNMYYLLSRFAWVFYLIALFFAVCALITGLLALCSRIGGYLSGFLTSIATFFMALAAALMTAWTVMAMQAFNQDPYNANASLGRYGYGFTWAAFAAYFLAMILFCVSGKAGGKKEQTYKEKKGLFGRKRSTRSKDGIRSEYS